MWTQRVLEVVCRWVRGTMFKFNYVVSLSSTSMLIFKMFIMIVLGVSQAFMTILKNGYVLIHEIYCVSSGKIGLYLGS